METILTFAQTISPLGIIALLVIVIYQLVQNTGIIGKLRGTQMDDKSTVASKTLTDNVDLAVLNSKLDSIANNHLHELPEMKLQLDRMEGRQQEQGERLTRVETKVEVLLK